VSDEVEPTKKPRLRSVLLGLAIGLSVAFASAAIAFSIIALPMYTLASTEPGSGVNRDLIRKGLFDVAIPFGLITGVAAGVLVTTWYARGGRLPKDRTPLYE
jgi:hypothetical protein